jgi:hypothetical protein
MIMSRLLLVPFALTALLFAPATHADCYSDSECNGGRCRSGKCTTR